MKNKISWPFIALALVLTLPLLAQAQNWTTVTATNITDLNQQKLAAGQLCFLATDRNDNPISLGIGGGGQLLRRAFCAAVANGAVSGFSVPNPANTVPAGTNYRVTVNDTSVGKEVLRYTQVAFAGTNFNFDAYAPTGAAPLVPLGNTVNGNLNVNGNLSITGALATSTFGDISATSYNNVVEADTQTGSDACAQIAAAIAALPATGGTVDARGIQGAQSCAANPFAGATVPVLLELGAVTITTSNSWALPSNVWIRGSGNGKSIIKLANGVNSQYLITNADTTNGNDHIAIRGVMLDCNNLNQSPNEGAGQRTGCIFFQKVTWVWIQFNEILNAYHFPVEIYKSSQYIWVTDNRIDGAINASGVLIGTMATPLPQTINEAYDVWVERNWIGNIGGGDCLFATGSNTGGTWGTARIHFNNNTLWNCGDVSIEIGDSTRDSEADNNIIEMSHAVSVSSISRASNVVTASFTCSWPTFSCVSTFKAGSPFVVFGVSDSSFNKATCTIGVDCFTVSTVNYSTNTITWAQTGSNASSSGGSAIRVGNQALLGRSSLNVDFKGNVVNGSGSSSDNGCEMSWHNTGDNAPSAQNHTWDNICNNMGGTAFKTVADASGTVTQIQHHSKHNGTVGNDYIIGSNTFGLRLMSGGYFSSGSSFAGLSFNQTNDLQFRPGTGSTAKFIFSSTNIGLGISNADFTPSSLVHIRSGSGGSDLTLEDTGNANKTILWKNAVQQWICGLRAAAGGLVATNESFVCRDVSNSTDVFAIAPSTGTWQMIGTIGKYNNIPTAGEGVTTIRAVTSQKSESSADANLLTLIPPATAGTYRISFVLSVAAANTATLGWTATWKNSNGTAQSPTNLSLFQEGTAAPALTFTTSAAGNYYGSAMIDVDTSTTAIVIKLTFTGTSFTGKASATIERLN